jgi:hypothetical protein
VAGDPDDAQGRGVSAALSLFAREMALAGRRAAGDLPALAWEALPDGEREVWWQAAVAAQLALARARAVAGEGGLSTAQAVEVSAEACYGVVAQALRWFRRWRQLDEAARVTWREGVRAAFAAAKAAPARVAA